MSDRRWCVVDTDEAFADLFANATVVRATTSPTEVPDIGAGLYWLLSDGTWLAMEVSTGGGCSTCGYGAGEKTYYVLGS